MPCNYVERVNTTHPHDPCLALESSHKALAFKPQIYACPKQVSLQEQIPRPISRSPCPINMIKTKQIVILGCHVPQNIVCRLLVNHIYICRFIVTIKHTIVEVYRLRISSTFDNSKLDLLESLSLYTRPFLKSLFRVRETLAL